MTEEHDVTTVAGHDFAMKAVRAGNTRLWASMQCIGGTGWNMQNYASGSPGTQAKIKDHWLQFSKIWSSFVQVAEECLKYSPTNTVCIEWPTKCAYWELTVVKEFLWKHGFIVNNLHGCAYGLVGINQHKGEPILKPWTIASTCPTDYMYLSKRCPGKAVHKDHARCEGKETKFTEEYTWPLVNAIHEALSLIHI